MKAQKEIQATIHKHYEELPANQKIIAEYFLENFERIPFLSVHEVAEATSRSVASVVRFAQRIGYSGFSELRDAMAGSLQNRIGKRDVFPLVKKKARSDDPLTDVANLDIQNINDTLNMIEREDFRKAINLIQRSSRVFTMGLGISSLLSQILSYQLNQVGIDARPFDHSYSSFVEQVLFLNEQDLLLGLSFPPYSKETIDAAHFARQNNVKVVSITNKKSAPITFESNVSLMVKSENMLFTNSFAAISVLINAIATGCAFKNKAKAQKMVDDINKIMIDYNHIVM